MSRTGSSTFATNLQRQLSQLVKACERCDQACLANIGVTAAQGYTLLSLPEKGDLSMNGLSEAMGLANSTMTRMVDQLVQKDLVRRQADQADRRVVRVGLTNQGREVHCALEKALHDFFGQISAEIPEHEQPMILRALEQVTRLVEKTLEGYCRD